MDKILVTSLENTLIPFRAYNCEILYGKNTNDYYEKKSYEALKNILNPYLEEGNKIVIIGNASYPHVKNDPNIDIFKIREILNKYSELIDIYLIGNITEEQKEIIKSQDIKHINKKEQVFEHIDLNKKIYCLGNDSEDIELLKRSLKNNAITGIILHRLLDPNFINQRGYVIQLVNEKIRCMVENELSNHHLSNVAKVQLEKRLWMNHSDELKKEILKLLYTGKITYLDVVKEWYLRKEIQYHYQYEDKPNISTEEMNFLLNNIPVYNSFHEFNELILKR